VRRLLHRPRRTVRRRWAYPPRSRIRFCFVRTRVLACLCDHTIARLHCLQGRGGTRMILSVLALAASLDAAIAQQPPAANTQTPHPAFVNGALAGQGAPRQTATLTA